MSTNSRRIAIAVSVLVLWGVSYAAWGFIRSKPLARDDAFLSYFQCADGLTMALAQIKSRDDFELPHPKIGDLDPDSAESMKYICDDFCEQLVGYKAAMEKMRADEIEESAERHAELVKRVKVAVANLARRHAETPEILREDWDAYAEALEPAAAQP